MTPRVRPAVPIAEPVSKRQVISGRRSVLLMIIPPVKKRNRYIKRIAPALRTASSEILLLKHCTSFLRLKTVIADKTNENSAERTFRVRFTLKGQAFDKTQDYYLNIMEKDSSGVPERVPFTIDIAFTNDFDF